jgi:hypothetical protein
MECRGDEDGNNRNEEQRSIKLSGGRFDSLFCEPNTSSEKAPDIRDLFIPTAKKSLHSEDE